jgi:hypothetical protein
MIVDNKVINITICFGFVTLIDVICTVDNKVIIITICFGFVTLIDVICTSNCTTKKTKWIVIWEQHFYILLK